MLTVFEFLVDVIWLTALVLGASVVNMLADMAKERLAEHRQTSEAYHQRVMRRRARHTSSRADGHPQPSARRTPVGAGVLTDSAPTGPQHSRVGE